jgi:hypothetical protein
MRNKVEKNFIRLLKTNGISLVANKNKNHQFDIEYIKKASAKIDGFLWQEIIVNQFYLYITMLGYLDVEADKMAEVLIEDRTSSYIVKKEQIRCIRKDIVDYIRDISACPSIIKKYINEVPITNWFIKINEDAKNNPTQLHLHEDFINAYRIGSESADYLTYEKIIKIYNSINNEIAKQTEKQKQQLLSAKCKTKQIR